VSPFPRGAPPFDLRFQGSSGLNAVDFFSSSLFLLIGEQELEALAGFCVL